jgi:cellulose biosynthesis protein BcsQ
LDFSITQEVLGAYGDAIKDQVRRVLKAIEAAREDGIDVSVTGMDQFDIANFSIELSDAQQLLALGVNSPTLKKEVSKKLALKYLADARQDVKDRIVAEIEQGPPEIGVQGPGVGG